MSSRLLRLLPLCLVLGVVTAFSTPSALAGNATLGIPAAQPEPDPDATIDDWRAWCRFEADRRRGKVESLSTEVAASLSLSTAHRDGLNTMLTATRDGLEALDAALATETDLDALKRTCVELETQHLVFSLRTPQVQNVIGADAVVTRSRTVESDSNALAPQIGAAELIGNPNVARMRELNATDLVLAPGARARVAGVSNALLALTPADWLAQRDILVPYQEKNRQSRAELETAKANIEEIKRLLLWTPPDTTPPVIVPTVAGPLGLNEWYVGDATVTWSVTDGESAVTGQTGCDPTSVTDDTASRVVTCSATSEGGTETVSVALGRDGEAPTVAYVAHPDSYTVDEDVAITCSATDALSGLDGGCAGVSGPAYTFGIGTTTTSTTVSDRAGNTATASTSFAVTVTPTSLCNLTKKLVQGAARYPTLSRRARKTVDALAAAACGHANGCVARLSPGRKQRLVALYKTSLTALQKPGWLTSGQVTLLGDLADRL